LIECDITSFFIGDFQSATFGGKNTALAQKYVKLAILHLCVGSSSKHLSEKRKSFLEIELMKLGFCQFQIP